MPSESVAGFLDRAQAVRVLHPDQVEQLVRQPDMPLADTGTLCEYLLGRGVLTKFQADAIREGRAHELAFGGYPVIDVLGPCAGGTAFRALHPSLRTPLVLRRYAPGAFAPTDDANALVARARTCGTIIHPHLLALLDAGVYQGEAYAVLDQPTDAADLDSLLKEVGGAMPAFLAAEYGHAVASALRAVHERGGWHGEVRPGLLLVGPLTTKEHADGTKKRRPAPNATVKLAETGLVPIRGAAASSELPAEVVRFLPPERFAGAPPDPRGDTYGLGASLYALLTGRGPYPGETTEDVLSKMRTSEPTPVAQLRPDVADKHPELAATVMKMIAKNPAERPPTAWDVCAALAPFCRPGTIPQAPQPVAAAPAHAVYPVPSAVPSALAPAPKAPPEDDWGVSANALAAAQAASAGDRTTPRRRQMTDADKSKARRWMLIGLCLHLSAMGLLAAWWLGAFDFLSEPSKPEPPPKKKGTDPRKKNA
jgi:eukaryotic-like serine/threonine-protein kinase